MTTIFTGAFLTQGNRSGYQASGIIGSLVNAVNTRISVLGGASGMKFGIGTEQAKYVLASSVYPVGTARASGIFLTASGGTTDYPLKYDSQRSTAFRDLYTMASICATQHFPKPAQTASASYVWADSGNPKWNNMVIGTGALVSGEVNIITKLSSGTETDWLVVPANSQLAGPLAAQERGVRGLGNRTAIFASASGIEELRGVIRNCKTIQYLPGYNASGALSHSYSGAASEATLSLAFSTAFTNLNTSPDLSTTDGIGRTAAIAGGGWDVRISRHRFNLDLLATAGYTMSGTGYVDFGVNSPDEDFTITLNKRNPNTDQASGAALGSASTLDKYEVGTSGLYKLNLAFDTSSLQQTGSINYLLLKMESSQEGSQPAGEVVSFAPGDPSVYITFTDLPEP